MFLGSSEKFAWNLNELVGKHLINGLFLFHFWVLSINLCGVWTHIAQSPGASILLQQTSFEVRGLGLSIFSSPEAEMSRVFSCIFYTICCSSGFLGEFGSCTEVSPVSLNRDFSTLFHFRGGKKAESLYMVLWEVLLSSMAGQVLYFQKRFCWRTRFAIKIGMSYFSL